MDHNLPLQGESMGACFLRSMVSPGRVRSRLGSLRTTSYVDAAQEHRDDSSTLLRLSIVSGKYKIDQEKVDAARPLRDVGNHVEAIGEFMLCIDATREVTGRTRYPRHMTEGPLYAFPRTAAQNRNMVTLFVE